MATQPGTHDQLPNKAPATRYHPEHNGMLARKHSMTKETKQRIAYRRTERRREDAPCRPCYSDRAAMEGHRARLARRQCPVKANERRTTLPIINCEDKRQNTEIKTFNLIAHFSIDSIV